jgi:penicillin-binding protein 2
MIEGRKTILQIIFIITGLIFLVKLFFIQAVDTKYRAAADSNVIMAEVDYPYRGLIYDRNGELIVYNTPEYDLMVIPKDIEKLDTTNFISLLNISKTEFEEKMMEARRYSRVKPSIFIKQLSNEDFARIQDNMDMFSGFFIQPRTTRGYNTTSLANALGYVSEISKTQLARDSNKYYRQGDYIGQSGIEAYYENVLRGKRGVRYKLRNVQGVEKGKFNEGKWDTLSIPGRNLLTTLDLTLQEYGEKLLKGKTGSIVAIEPKTGEILAFVSGPTYDPAMLTGRKFSSNFSAISKDSLKPLFTRPLMAMYPPGSIFKMVQSLIGLQESVLAYSTVFPCNRQLVNCHNHPNPTDLFGAIKYSCNPYFHQTFRRIINQNKDANTYTDSRIGLDLWKSYVDRFGLGKPLGIDIPNEKAGQMPGSSLYNRIYGENRWRFSTIYSLAIGQGEMLVTPLQMTNLAVIIANKGYYFTPHLVKGIEGDEHELQYARHETGIDEKHFEFVQLAMTEAIYGTAGRAVIPDIKIAGKTGTAENPHGEDHSVFMAFAPYEDPKIAISVYVENAGWGGRAAASIASLMIEKYLKGSTKRPYLEDYVLKGEFLY